MKTYQRFASSHGPTNAAEDLCLVIDGSPSMKMADFHPSRLQGAIDSACALIDIKQQHYPNDRVGVVSFAHDGQVHLPLRTVGTHADLAKQALNNVPIRYATNIAAGLECGASVLTGCKFEASSSTTLSRLCATVRDTLTLDPPNKRPKRLLLLTDGEDNCSTRDELYACADHLKRQGITVVTIGIGGSPADVNETDLKRISSIDPATGDPQYCFINDTESLIVEFKRQAHHLARLSGKEM